MKYLVLILLICLLSGHSVSGVAGKNLSHLPLVNQIPVKKALERAGDNAAQLTMALESARQREKEPVAFLISTMPDRDLQSLTADFILENIRLALKARKEFKWCKALPDSVFLNEVLPYCCLNENRDNWRADFYSRFYPLVKNCRTIREAIDSVNLNILKVTGVEYNTRRKKTDQSPYESIGQKMATCTGLSILLTDAFRSVGIPSRIAGTPMWTNMRGNHSWCEVWVDGKWYFTEYYPEKLNHSWFVADAGKADREKPLHWIYASSWKPTGLAFPCVWDSTVQYVYAHNVTDFYIDLYEKQFTERKLAEDEVILNMVLYRIPGTTDGNDRVLKRISLMKDGKEVNFGYSPSEADDMNHFLQFVLKKNTAYTIVYPGKDGVKKTFDYTTTDRSGEIIRLNQ